jgi:hypothetical protein
MDEKADVVHDIRKSGFKRILCQRALPARSVSEVVGRASSRIPVVVAIVAVSKRVSCAAYGVAAVISPSFVAEVILGAAKSISAVVSIGRITERIR